MADPDWWARGLGATGTAMAALALAVNRYDSRWKRRHVAMERVRGPLNDLAPAIRNSQDPQQVRNLFSVVASSHVNDLTEAVDRIPDFRFRRHLRSLVEALAAVRGGQMPTNPDGSQPGLTQSQIDKIRVAKRDLRWLVKRMNTAAKRGGA